MSPNRLHPATESKKLPKQERSKRTYSVILEGAAKIIREEGIDKLTTNRVASESKVSIGSLYQYFPSKVAIVAALIEQAQQKDLEEVQAALEDWAKTEVPPLAAATRFFAYYYHFEKGDLSLRRALIDATPAADRLAHAMKYHGKMAEMVVRHFQTHSQARCDNVSQVVFVLKYVLKGITLSSIDGEMDHMNREELAKEWAQMFLRLLQL